MVFTSNFEFLKAHGVWFYNLAASAERNFTSDPNTTLIKMRQLGEATAQNIEARERLEKLSQTVLTKAFKGEFINISDELESSIADQVNKMEAV
ncbi:hypothetical protein [Alteromonas macleodii]|uniref:Uncharacterized protein n=1 Tax=Alteromonas macleodii TaxID=28108 RepID=A0A6T9YAG6_ALTMA|nr:hypothetical protein [Alteromonas macleodii]CAB9495353.1 protein of unknown function [Alteromonas macleodii]